jgi:hypothetical protein
MHSEIQKDLEQCQKTLNRMPKIAGVPVQFNVSVGKNGKFSLYMDKTLVGKYKTLDDVKNNASYLALGCRYGMGLERGMRKAVEAEQKSLYKSNRDRLADQIRSGMTTLSPDPISDDISEDEQYEVMVEEHEDDIRSTLEDEAEEKAVEEEMAMHPEYGHSSVELDER